MQKVFGLSGLVSSALAVVTRLILGAIVLLVLYDVAMRNLARPVAWTASFIEILLIYVAFLPMPWLVRQKGHVCADFLRHALPPGARRAAEKLVCLLAIGICLYLGGIAFELFAENVRTGAYDVRSFDVPRWSIYLPMVVGMWLSAVEFLRFLFGEDSLYAVDVRDIEGF
ncbi:TRAP transporter small permease [Prosthecomicrobium sp. N25]|uniref:TRAP transporter small permease n=1 Tax=Prosthecomicrobium sp. N25 TaxID=3129254 RepID=UPI003077ECFC